MMRPCLLATTLAIASAAFAQPASEQEAMRSQQEQVRRAVARMAPSVVTIETVGGAAPADPVGGSDLVPAEGPTTGFVFGADGLILTSSFNFVRDPAVITVRLADGSRLPAKLVARDELRRLAMLKIAATGLAVPTWASEKDVRVGRWSIALGRGFGGEGLAVSVGIVSGLNRMGGLAVQTDAKVSPVNYGGPLLDMSGQVIGIIVPMSYMPGELPGLDLYDAGIGFAIPFWQAEPYALALAQGRSVRRGWFGIRTQFAPGKGLVISGVVDGSPAMQAGIQAGDELAAINDKPVRSMGDFQRLTAFLPADEPVALTVRRGGNVIQLDATLKPRDARERPPAQRPRRR